MASWSENSSYQGAASGAAAGAATGNPYVAAAGAVVGFVAGGMMGGAQEDAAKAAEEERLKEIQRAIDRQNTRDFKTKAQAEQWALADIGINKADQVMDAKANKLGLQRDVLMNERNTIHAARSTGYGVKHNVTEDNWEANKANLLKGSSSKSYGRNKYITKVDDSIHSTRLARDAVKANEGILSNYDPEERPTKY